MVLLKNGMLISFGFVDVATEDKLMALAHQKYKAGNYNQALEHSIAAYERNPQRTDNLLLLGAIYYQVIVEFLVSGTIFSISFFTCVIVVSLLNL